VDGSVCQRLAGQGNFVEVDDRLVVVIQVDELWCGLLAYSVALAPSPVDAQPESFMVAHAAPPFVQVGTLPRSFAM
jgi:hypothetical protein